MPRGFKRDENATANLRGLGELKDPRSFMSLPKLIIWESSEPRPHLVLYGEEDKGRVRAEIFRRNRQANDGVNRCWKCRREVKEEKFVGMPGMPVGEWDHIRNKAGERCDCPENGRVACRACHKPRHPQPQFSKRISEQEESANARNAS